MCYSKKTWNFANEITTTNTEPNQTRAFSRLSINNLSYLNLKLSCAYTHFEEKIELNRLQRKSGLLASVIGTTTEIKQRTQSHHQTEVWLIRNTNSQLKGCSTKHIKPSTGVKADLNKGPYLDYSSPWITTLSHLTHIHVQTRTHALVSGTGFDIAQYNQCSQLPEQLNL